MAVAGAGDELVRLLLDELTEAGGAPQASVIGHQTRLPALAAALVNGAAGHALDYDDVNMAMPGHPSVAILPGLHSQFPIHSRPTHVQLRRRRPRRR